MKNDKRALQLSLAALGVVYGDIGTSAIYALRECFYGPHKIEVTSQNVFGVLSLVVWSLLITVSGKYLLYRGPGGAAESLAFATRHQALVADAAWPVRRGAAVW
jgi:KUP system potassium uptake protein